jgi:hypothetical protein
MKRAFCLLMLVPASVAAQESTIVLDGIVDTSYAWRSFRLRRAMVSKPLAFP